MTRKHPRPRSWQVGPFTVRQDAGASRTVRVFLEGVEVFSHDDLGVALAFARESAPGVPHRDAEEGA